MLHLGAVSVVPMAEEDDNNMERVEVNVPKGWKWVLASGRLPLALWKCGG